MSTDGRSIQDLISGLARRLTTVRRKRESLEFWRRSLISFSGFAGAAFLAVLAEVLGFLPSVTRTIIDAILILLVLPAAVIWSAPPLLRLAGMMKSEPIDVTARRVGGAFPDIRDRLLNIIQLGSQQDHHAWVSSELIEDSVRGLHAELEGLDLTRSIERAPLRETAKRSGIALSVVVITVLLWPGSFRGGMQRMWNYDMEYSRPRAFAFAMEPGNTEVAKGSDVSVRFTISAADGARDLPDEAQLFMRAEGQSGFEPIALRSAAPGSFAFDVPSIRYSQEYFAAVGDDRSGTFTITVLDWPSFQSFRVRLDHPSYAGLPATLQDDFSGEIVALAGTRVTVSGRASKELSSGEIVFDDSSTVPLRVDESSFEAGFTVAQPGSYAVRIRDADGLPNRSPITYQIRMLPDAPPAVAITQPGRNIDIAGGESVGLVVEASDDYGLSGLKLRYRLSHSKFVRVSDRYESAAIPLPSGGRRDVTTTYLWQLGPLDLVPEDVVEYFVEAFDNDTVNGPKSARSQVYTLRLPSLEEVFADAETGHEQTLQDLDEARKNAEQLRDDIEKINRDLKTNKEFDWQDQQKAEEMAKKVEDVRKGLQKAEQQLKSMTDEMQRQQVLSPETLEKYLELQNLFQQMDTSELQQALKQMQQAMQGVRPQQMQQAMQQVEFSEKRFRQGIERTLNLLKRIQIEQKMDEAVKRAEDLTAKQEELSQIGEEKKSQQANEQEALAAEQKRLEESLGDLQRRMEEFFTEMPADKLSDINKDLRNQQLQQQMMSAAQQLRAGQQLNAQLTQQKIQQSLENLTQEMQSMQQEMLANQTDRIMNELRRASSDLLELSQRQENVKNEAQSSQNSSPALRDNAQRQMQIMQDLNNVAANLSELAQKSFAVTPELGRSVGEAMQKMQDAMRSLDVRNGSQASQDQTGAMGYLNRSAQQVQQSLQTMMQGSQGAPGGMGLMQQLQLMAGKQMQLNMQTQELGGKGGDMPNGAEQAARIAKEQEAVRKSLQQLQQEARKSADKDRVLGDLDRIAKDMQEVVRNLEQNNVDDQTIRQQERILSRLLDASRSMRERDFEKRREATTGRQFTRTGPASLPSEETKNRLREEMLRALEKGYSRDYQELIRKYFEELEKADKGER